MDRITTVIAMTVAGLVVASAAFGQATAPGGAGSDPGARPETGAATGKSDTGSAGGTTMPGSGSPAASPGTRSGAADATRAEGKAAASREQVKAAQQALKDKGHDPGPVDGMMGPRTRQALKDFQKAQGLRDTGRLDAETMARLGVAARTGAAGGSSPAASPGTEAGASPRTSAGGAGQESPAARPGAGTPTGQTPEKK